MKGLRGRNVLITGASSGIGQACAVRFAQEGANVAINYHGNREGAERTKSVCEGQGVKAILVKADASSENQVLDMFKRTLAELGGIGVLINNSGIQIKGAAHEMKTEDFDKVIAVNLRGAYLCAREAIKHFLAEGKQGVIINMSSVHEVIPRPMYLGYSVSKGGMRNLTRTLALAYADRGIRVNAVAPGATVTPINQAWTEDPQKKAEVEKHIPMGRVGVPEEAAAATAFLASDESAYITGQTLFVDGGLSLFPDFRSPWSGTG